MGPAEPGDRLADHRLDRRVLDEVPRHRTGCRGGLLHRAVGAAADLRPGRRNRLRHAVVQPRPGRSRPDGAPRPRVAVPDRLRGEQRDPADHRRRSRGRPVRRDLGGVRAGPLVGVTGDARLRRHHHDHARAQRSPRDREDPRPVVQPLPAGDRHWSGGPAAGRGRTAPGPPLAPGPRRLPGRLLLAGGAGPLHLLPGHALPRLDPGADQVADQPPGRDVRPGRVGAGQLPAARLPHRDGRGLALDLRTARSADRHPALALHPLDRRPGRGGSQRRVDTVFPQQQTAKARSELVQRLRQRRARGDEPDDPVQ